MNKKILKFTAAIVVFTIIVLAFNILTLTKKRVGDLVFGSAAERFYDIKEIVISTEGLTVTLQADNGTWKIPEANGYFADYLTINELFTSFRMAKFYQEVEKGKVQGTNIKIIDKKDKIISDITIGERVSEEFVLVQNAGEENIYMAVDTFELPTEMMSWLQQPLMSIETLDIEMVDINGSVFKREDVSTLFPESLTRVLKVNSFLYFEEVKKLEDVNLDNYAKRSRMSLTTFDGLISTLDFYFNGEEYWVVKKLSSTKLPLQGVNDYIRVNSSLYDGWIFKLPSHVGAVLFNSQI